MKKKVTPNWGLIQRIKMILITLRYLLKILQDPRYLFFYIYLFFKDIIKVKILKEIISKIALKITNNTATIIILAMLKFDISKLNTLCIIILSLI